MALSSLAVFAADAPEHEVRLLVELVRLSRITVLYAEAGADKSAVVRTSVMPLLRTHTAGSRRDVAVLLDDWAAPPLPELSARLESAIAAATGRNVPAAPAFQSTLAQQLAEWQEDLDVNFIIVFDRFDELLAARADRPDLQRFEDEWVEAVNIKALRANFLLSLDEDAAHGLEPLRSRVPGLGDARVRLPAPKVARPAPVREGPVATRGMLTGSEARRPETLAERLERMRAEYSVQSREVPSVAEEAPRESEAVARDQREEPGIGAPATREAPFESAPALQGVSRAATAGDDPMRGGAVPRRAHASQRRSLMRTRAGIAVAAVLIALACLALFKAQSPIERAQVPEPSAEIGQPQEPPATQQPADAVPQVDIAELATDELPLRSEGEYAVAEQAPDQRFERQGRASAPPSAAAPSGPLLYIHIRDEAQRARAQRMIKPLATRGIRVSGIKVVSFGPQVTDLRYFRAAERDEAQRVGRALRDIGVPAQQLKFVSGFEQRATHRQYELWLPPERRGR